MNSGQTAFSKSREIEISLLWVRIVNWWGHLNGISANCQIWSVDEYGSEKLLGLISLRLPPTQSFMSFSPRNPIRLSWWESEKTLLVIIIISELISQWLPELSSWQSPILLRKDFPRALLQEEKGILPYSSLLVLLKGRKFNLISEQAFKVIDWECYSHGWDGEQREKKAILLRKRYEGHSPKIQAHWKADS